MFMSLWKPLSAIVSRKGSYEKRLGLMQQVKSDLAELKSTTITSCRFQPGIPMEGRAASKKVFSPRGPARVIVYIDDLDRCPPDRVVQVLEAVQLLVKTPPSSSPFLPLTSATSPAPWKNSTTASLTRRGRPSGTDYLEKIIQLPYRVRPIMSNTLETYLRSQVVIQDDANGRQQIQRIQQPRNLICCWSAANR